MKQYSTVPCFSLSLVKERDLEYPVSKVGDAKDAEAALTAYLSDKDCEHLVVLMLAAGNNLIGLANVAIGGVSGLSCAVRDVFKAAIVARASGLILGHNHPSGDCTPSKEDIAFTKRAIEAGSILGVPVIDHVIVSSGMVSGSFSMLEHGMMGM
jgi:DNA repair protein RadC